MNETGPLLSFAFYCIRPASALAIVPISGIGGAVGVLLRLPLIFAIALAHGAPTDPQVNLISIAWEIGVGLALGCLLISIYVAASAAGELLDSAAGYTFASFYDPQIAQQSTVFQLFMTQLCTWILFTGAGLQAVFDAILSSWQWLPAAGMRTDLLASLAHELSGENVAQALAAGLRWAASLWALLLIAEVAAGLANRTVPALGAFGIAFALKAALLALGLCIALPWLGDAMTEFFHASLRLP